jgi:hypothetical protein
VEITLDVADSVPRKERTYALLIRLKIETVTERRMTEVRKTERRMTEGSN